MEIIDPEQKQQFEQRKTNQAPIHSDSTGRIMAGLIIIIIGGLLLARKLGIYFPEWLFSWQTLIIAIGIFIGAKNSFRPGGWLMPIFIGVLFLFGDWMPELNIRHYFFPIILIGAGMLMILTPGRRSRMSRYSRRGIASGKVAESNEELMESVAVFGGIKKNVISKNFRGGEAISIFGGTDINLSQADIIGNVELELVQIFGGTKIVLPPHWQVKSEMVSIFGGIEDMRHLEKNAVDYNKTLILKGVSLFGSIEIKSY